MIKERFTLEKTAATTMASKLSPAVTSATVVLLTKGFTLVA
jgi:hypothetical protein